MRGDAERELDPDGRATKLRIAEEYARGWRCPIAAGPQAFGAVGPCDRSEGRGDTLDAVERLTGIDTSELTTCPVSVTYRTEVHRAMRAWKWRRRGGIRNVEPNPSMVLLDAVDEIDSGVDSCRAETMRRHAEKMRRDAEEHRHG